MLSGISSRLSFQHNFQQVARPALPGYGFCHHWYRGHQSQKPQSQHRSQPADEANRYKLAAIKFQIPPRPLPAARSKISGNPSCFIMAKITTIDGVVSLLAHLSNHSRLPHQWARKGTNDLHNRFPLNAAAPYIFTSSGVQISWRTRSRPCSMFNYWMNDVSSPDFSIASLDCTVVGLSFSFLPQKNCT